MGEPTQGERSLPHTTFFEDPAFLEWARRRGTPVTRGTPTGELTELNSAWEFEKREARRREDDRRRPRPAPPREAQPVVDDVRLRKRIREMWGQGSPELRATAEREVHALRPISRLLFGSHQFDEERERWTFMRHYFRALGIAFGDGEPAEEELLDHVLKEEKVYRIELARREDARERAGRPHRQSAALRKWAKKRSMDLVDAFDPGIAVYDIDNAMQKPDWMENGLVSIEQDDDMRVVLRYETGPPLKFPAKAIDFNRTYADAVVDLVARRHTASGRLMPFAFYDRNVDLLDDLPETDAITNPNDRALIALPRFDADLTPLVLSYYSDEQFRWRLVRGVLKVTAAMSLYKLRRPAASLTARTLAATAPVVTGVRAAAQRVVIAVSIHGVTRSAAVHLARAAYTYYLTHAIAINTYGLLGTEIVLSLGGHDAGSVSQGDTLTMATKTD
ncbi:MAG TPA: hypothetical protein VHK90_15030, partial [Thermoanaerobaculia bacterium]|nr:hypothetical protein [Thermoanaerobaculia bacterium]